MADDMMARLESHARAFEGLMSLIPAKLYYGEDNDDQWQRKKQTKEEKRAAKKAKLQPGAYKSALDVHKEKELKRKRELEEEEGHEMNDTPLDEASEGAIAVAKNEAKKVKIDKDVNGPSARQKPDNAVDTKDPVDRQAYIEKRRAKRERQKAREAKEREKKQAKKARKQQVGDLKQDHVLSIPVNGHISPREDENAGQNQIPIGTIEQLNVESLADNQEHQLGSTALTGPTFGTSVNENSISYLPSPSPSSSTLPPSKDASYESKSQLESASKAHQHNPTASAPEIISHSSKIAIKSRSTPMNRNPHLPSLPFKTKSDSESDIELELETSTNPATEVTTQPDEKTPKIPKIDSALLQERLAARLAALRAARKADGLDGKPARSRQELIEARRRKEEARKQRKKEVRLKAKQEQNAEEEAARLRGGSGSPLWSAAEVSARARGPENSFSYGRVAFEDGTEADPSFSGLVEAKKRKGPSDPRTALEAAQKKKERINGLDPSKRADVEEKDRWMNAKKRVHGDKIRDDTNLLKKTLKRKEKGKLKSAQEWEKRLESVQHGKEMKQKTREENLAKRREEKGAKGKKKTSGKPKGPKVKRRPGFEGTFSTGRRSKP